MKTPILFLLCFFLTAPAAYAETMYVTDMIEVMVRTGPDISHKIIAMPKSGTKVEVVEVVDDWAMVILPNEKEGWMLTRYLSPNPPQREIVTKLRKENRDLRLQAKTLDEQNAQLKKKCKELKAALLKETKTSYDLRKSYETLKRESKDFLALKSSYQKASKELVARTRRLNELEQEVKALRESRVLWWFISGAAVILIGFILGYLSRRPKRRPSLLE